VLWLAGFGTVEGDSATEPEAGLGVQPTFPPEAGWAAAGFLVAESLLGACPDRGRACGRPGFGTPDRLAPGFRTDLVV